MKKDTIENIIKYLLIIALLSFSFACLTSGIKNIQYLITDWDNNEAVVSVKAYYNSDLPRGGHEYLVYHKPNCSYLSRMENDKRVSSITYHLTRQEAERLQYFPCNYCF